MNGRVWRCIIPFQDDMGSIAPIICSGTPMESREDSALWEFNSMRRHDGLRECKQLPKGTRFERVQS